MADRTFNVNDEVVDKRGATKRSGSVTQATEGDYTVKWQDVDAAETLEQDAPGVEKAPPFVETP